MDVIASYSRRGQNHELKSRSLRRGVGSAVCRNQYEVLAPKYETDPYSPSARSQSQSVTVEKRELTLCKLIPIALDGSL